MNYRLWLKGNSIDNGPNSTTLKLKIVARCGDPKLLVDVMKTCLGVEDVIIGIVFYTTPNLYDTLAPLTMWSMNFGLAMTSSSIAYMSTRRNMHWISNILWLVRICTNLSREKVFVLVDSNFNKGRHFQCIKAIGNDDVPHSSLTFSMLSNSNAHPTTRFSKTIC